MRHPPEQLPPDVPDDLPPALLRDLSDLYAGPAVPPMVDARIRNDAAAHFARAARTSRPGRLLRWVGGGAAAAAAVALAVTLLPREEAGPRRVATVRDATPATHVPPGTPSTVALAEDVDRDGRVNILDAFAIARALEAQSRPPDAWDVNGDGQVDQGDVDRVAGNAVRVTGVASADGRRPVSRDDVFSHVPVESGGNIR